MTSEQIYQLWAPETSPWARWAKAVLFRDLPEGGDFKIPTLELPPADWMASSPAGAGLILDLPGLQAIDVALGLLTCGFQPVPLFNCCSSTMEEVLPTAQLRAALVWGSQKLEMVSPNPAAMPAFILDADRLAGKGIPSAGTFDNRWMVFPQDFPSATFLLQTGVSKMILVQKDSVQPLDDLRKILLDWQEGGIEILSKNLDSAPASRMQVTPLPRLRWFFQRLLMASRLRRDTSGGFGSIVPGAG